MKDFRYGDTFVWISWKQFTESDAEDICISNNHEPLTIEEPKILPGIFKNVKPGFKVMSSTNCFHQILTIEMQYNFN